MRPLALLLAGLAALAAALLWLAWPRPGSVPLSTAALDSAENGSSTATPADAWLAALADAEPRAARTEAAEPLEEPARSTVVARSAGAPRAGRSRASALLVHVTDDRGLDVAGAEVELRARGEVWSAAGRTDVRGRATVLVPASPGARVRASAPDRLVAELELPEPLPAEARLVLATRGPLGGAVRWLDRSRIGAGVEVRAMLLPPESAESPPEARDGDARSMASSSAAATEPPDAGVELGAGRIVATAVTDELGRFVLQDLDAAREYRVTAHTPGLVCARPGRARPGRRVLRVEVGVPYGVLVRLVGPGGAPLVEHPDPRTRAEPRRPRRRHELWLEPADLVAAGFLPAHLAAPRFDRRLVLLAALPRPDGVLEPVPVSVDLAGYEPASKAVVPRALEGGLAEVELVLEPLPCGALELVALLPPPGLDPETLGPRVRLEVPGPQSPCVYELRLGATPALVETVPAGRFVARLQVHRTMGWEQWSPVAQRELEVRAGERTRWTVDLRELALVRFSAGLPCTLYGKQVEDQPAFVEGQPVFVYLDAMTVGDPVRATAVVVAPGEYAARRLAEGEDALDEESIVIAIRGEEDWAWLESGEPDRRFTAVAGATVDVTLPAR